LFLVGKNNDVSEILFLLFWWIKTRYYHQFFTSCYISNNCDFANI